MLVDSLSEGATVCCSDEGMRPVKRSSLLSKVRKVFSLDLEGDLMAVLGAAERLKPGIMDFVCGSLLHGS